MSNKMWDALLDHAKTCVLSGKLYVYYPEDTRNAGVVFNNIYELRGLINGEHFYNADSLSDHQKVRVAYVICFLVLSLKKGLPLFFYNDWFVTHAPSES
jgi:hypothetical protein